MTVDVVRGRRRQKDDRAAEILRLAPAACRDPLADLPKARGVGAERRGVLRNVMGLDRARAVPDIEDIRITAKPDQVLIPLPEGASYLGFIFARAPEPAAAVAAVRLAHERLVFDIEPELRVLQSVHG